MTDYGQFFEKDEQEEYEEKQRKEINREINRQLSQTKSCNTTTGRMGLFLRHCNSLQTVMKAASNDGFCLNELVQGVKEIEGVGK